MGLSGRGVRRSVVSPPSPSPVLGKLLSPSFSSEPENPEFKTMLSEPTDCCPPLAWRTGFPYTVEVEKVSSDNRRSF